MQTVLVFIGIILTEPQIAFVLTESLKALSYIHSMHRLHRDIKSDNILLSEDGDIKLADFGFAVQLTQKQVGLVYAHDHRHSHCVLWHRCNAILSSEHRIGWLQS